VLAEGAALTLLQAWRAVPIPRRPSACLSGSARLTNCRRSLVPWRRCFDIVPPDFPLSLSRCDRLRTPRCMQTVTAWRPVHRRARSRLNKHLIAGRLLAAEQVLVWEKPASTPGVERASRLPLTERADNWGFVYAQGTSSVPWLAPGQWRPFGGWPRRLLALRSS